MRVLYLNSDPGIEWAGSSGSSIHVRSFVRALSGMGHQVTVVCTSTGRIPDEASDALVPAPLARWNRALVRVSKAGSAMLHQTGRKHPDPVRLLHNVTFCRTAREAVRAARPAFIYERYSLWGLAGTRLAKELSVPLVLEVNAPLVYEQERYRHLTLAPLARRLESAAWRRADILVAVSESLRSHFREAGVEEERIRVLPNAVDPLEFRPEADGASVRGHYQLEGRFVIGFVGSFKPWHGVEFLLEAFRELHASDTRFHLLLVGDGPLRQSLEERAEGDGLAAAVTFTGKVAHQEMPRYLAAMDVAVAPYPALESFYYSPVKLFEYMAAGRGIVASRIGQVSQVIADRRTGLLFEPGNRYQFIRHIRELAQNPSLRRELGHRARETSFEYTWSQNASRVLGWVEPLMMDSTTGQ